MRTARDGRRIGKRAGSGLSEVKRLVSGPALLFAALSAKAAMLGISANEATRRAIRAWLGWNEVVPQSNNTRGQK